jgi:hypothetical protein
MPYYEFKKTDIFRNVLKTHPANKFLIYSGSVYYNNRIESSGAFTGAPAIGAIQGVSLYELNVDRNADQTGLIYPFVTKDGTLSAFKTISTTSFNSDFGYGDTITGSYPLSASLTREYITDSTRRHIHALKNTLNFYKPMSSHYDYNSSLGNKQTQDISLVSIPSIFYGSSIEKGTVKLSYYITGSLVAELTDLYKNGELIQTAPVGSNGSGSVAGVVLYNEGFILLTGSWEIEDDTSIQRDYIDDPTNKKKSAWLYWGTTMNDGFSADGTGTPASSASYSLDFSGTMHTPVLTMLAHAKMGQLNYSNNPTFLQYNQTGAIYAATSSVQYAENSGILIKNTISSSFKHYREPGFNRQTFITKVGVYDEDKNLIAIASVATPIKKYEDNEYTFKLKLDI